WNALSVGRRRLRQCSGWYRRRREGSHAAHDQRWSHLDRPDHAHELLAARVTFLDSNIGIAVGAENLAQPFSLVLRTTDGGATWTRRSFSSAAPLFGVSFVNSETGTAAGYGGALLRTNDRGLTWVPQTSETNTSLLGVSFANASTGTAVG